MSQDYLSHTADQSQAAMFIDYDNLYTILNSQSDRSRSTGSYAEEIFEEVRRYLNEGDDTPTIFARAYGSFDTLLDEADADVPSALHRRGIEPVHVPTGMQSNTAEIRLTMDLTDFLRRRPEVQTLVVVTGNRPYLPLVRGIREQGCRPLVAAVNPPQTADSPSFIEDSRYLDARNLLSQESREDLLSNAPASGAAYTSAQSPESPPPQQYQSLDDSTVRRALEITEEHFGQYDEVYLTPLLRKLSDLLGDDADP
ncbi:MAG: NYN domain-containing protein, partial [Salinibacter sp.]